MKSSEKKILFFLCLGIFFALLILNNNNTSSYNNDTSSNNKELSPDKEETDLKTSGAWVMSNITIDDTGGTYGAYTWDQAKDEAWCSLQNSIYIIENITIDASTSPTGSGILIKNSNTEDFIIRNCTISDPVKPVGGGYPNNITGCIKLVNSRKGQIYSNNLTSTTGADLHKAGISLYESRYISIINNTVDGNTFGIFMRNSNESLIFNNSADSNYHVGIFLQENCHYNNITQNSASFNILYYGIALYTKSDNNNIINNTANNNDDYGIYLQTGCSDNKIINNTAGNTGGGTNQNTGIQVYNSDDNNITENVCNGNVYWGIYLRPGCDYNNITGNTANNNGHTGIYIERDETPSEYNIISGNAANGNGAYGIYLYRCDYINITGNTANDNTEYGIYLYWCGNINITVNTANDNGKHGIYLDYRCNDNNISGNIVNGNDDKGIFLYDGCDDNTIKNNTINNNAYAAIFIEQCENIMISGNEMIGGGIGLEGNQYTHYSTHKIYTNNTVNGNIVYYYVEENSLKASNFSDAGQVLLINCNNSMISDVIVSQVWCGIFLYNSNYNNITGNTANGNSLHGIYLNGCDNNTITGNKNTINSNGICGIFLEDSHWNNITDNIANSNGIYGICLNSSSYNNILDNELIGNKIPFYNDSYCVGNVFEGNIVSRPLSITSGDDDDDDEKEADTTGIVIAIVVIIVACLVGAIAIFYYTKPELLKSFVEKIKNPLRRVLQQKNKLREDKLKKIVEEPLKSDETDLYEIDTRLLDSFLRVFLLCVVGLTISALIVNFFNLVVLAIVLSVGAGLLLSLIYMIWLLRDLKLSIKLEKLNLKNFGIGILLVAGLYCIVFLILIFGSQIPWFDYYIVHQSEDPYLIYGFIVPYLYLKVTSTIISVLAFFLFTMYFDLKKINYDITKARKQKKSPSEIYFLKEEFVGKYSTRILYKTMGFVLIIGVAMIPYTTEGFQIILPLMLMLFVPFSVIFLIVILIQKSHVKKTIKYEFILENTKICTNCKKIALFSASYCGECGKPFESSYQYHESMNKCQNCDSINPHNYKYCRYCGNIITVESSEAKRKFGLGTIKRVLLRKN